MCSPYFELYISFFPTRVSWHTWFEFWMKKLIIYSTYVSSLLPTIIHSIFCNTINRDQMIPESIKNDKKNVLWLLKCIYGSTGMYFTMRIVCKENKRDFFFIFLLYQDGGYFQQVSLLSTSQTRCIRSRGSTSIGRG